MTWAKIQSYYADWDCSTGKGKIGLKDEEGEWHWNLINNEEEFLNLTNLLKEEDVVYIDKRVGHLGQILRPKPEANSKNILADIAVF